MLGIVIPTYNRAGHLHVLLEFFSRVQDVSWFELIILDNCSEYDVTSLISAYMLRGVPIILSSAEENTGSMESNIERLFQIREFDLPRYTYIWVLGDDDLPIRESFNLIHKLMPENSACIIFGKCFSEIRAENLKDKNTYRFETISLYFKELVESSIYNPEAGFTFISNALLRQDIFAKVYGLYNRRDLDAPQTNLTVLSQLCRLEECTEEEIKGVILAVRLDLVRVAFKTIGGHSAVLEGSYTRLYGKESPSSSYFRLRAFLDTWLAISPNICKISRCHGHAALWFYRHLEYYARIIAASICQADDKFCHWEYHLFSAYLNRLSKLAASEMLLDLRRHIASKRLYPVVFSEYSLGCDGFFCPMNGYIKGLSKSDVNFSHTSSKE